MIAPLHVFENHDEAYHIWRRAGFTGKTLVHLDAHHDMYWLKSRSELHIHARLARLDERHGHLAEAAAGYRMAIAARDRLTLRLCLARTYAKQARWWSAGREAIVALKCAPADARAAARTCAARIRRHREIRS
jgi:hypothetical protein